MKNYSQWKDNEVKKLFHFVENEKQKGVCLVDIFSLYAKLSKRMPNSVRNYYYTELNNLCENEQRRNKLKIDISLHQKSLQKEFSKEETEKLVSDILSLTSKGMSVRKACLTLAKNDISLMVRYQNKFRTVILKDKTTYNKCINNLKIDTKKPSNIITIPERKTLLSDSDINSLFLGLVKLVKKQATDEASLNFRKIIVELNNKEQELKNLRRSFKVLELEKQKLSEELKNLRVKNLKLDSLKQKIQKLATRKNA